MRVAWLVFGVGLTVLTACGTQGTATVGSAGTPSAEPLPQHVFVAEYEHGAGDIGGGNGTFLSVFDEQTGDHLRDLAHIKEGTTVNLGGFSRGADGSVVYAVDQGPYYRGHLPNGDPKPGSCGATVYRVNADTGQTTSLFTVGKDWIVRQPMISPDGQSVAYLSQECTAAEQQVVVRDLQSGTERHIWVPGTTAFHLSWSRDGTQLVFAVGYPQANHTGYVVTASDAEGPQPDTAVRPAPDAGCVVEDATFAADGVQLVEGCPDFITPPARLVQLDGDGPRVSWRADTGLCPNAMTAGHDPSGRLLVTATTTCGGPSAPVDVVQMWTGTASHHEVGRYINPRQFVSAAT